MLKLLKNKKVIIIAAAFLALVIAFLCFLPSIRYNKALKLIEKGEGTKAYKILSELGDYKDSADRLKNFTARYKICVESSSLESISHTTRYEYDDFGNITKESGEGGENSYKYEYDKNGNMLSRELYYDNVLREKEEYDEQGNLLKYTKDKSFVTYSYTFDESKKPVSYTVCDQNGTTVETGEYKKDGSLVIKKINYTNVRLFDAAGNTVKSNFYNSLGNLSEFFEYSYDEHGNKLEAKRFDANGNITETVTYSYEKPEYFYK